MQGRELWERIGTGPWVSQAALDRAGNKQEAVFWVLGEHKRLWTELGSMQKARRLGRKHPRRQLQQLVMESQPPIYTFFSLTSKICCSIALQIASSLFREAGRSPCHNTSRGTSYEVTVLRAQYKLFRLKSSNNHWFFGFGKGDWAGFRCHAC